MHEEQNKSPKPDQDVVDQYTRQAAEYARSATHSDAQSLAQLVRFASLPPGVSVLDVATGTGFTAFAFAEAGCLVTGLDLTAAMLSHARAMAQARGLSGLEFVRGRAEALPFAAGSFHAVTCRVSAHHFSRIELFLSEARRVLRRGGALVIADTSSPDDAPALGEWFNRVESLRDPSHRLNYSPAQWRDMTQRAGFRVEATDYSQRIRLSFSRWVAMAGTPPQKVKTLRRSFTDAPREVKSFFEIREEEGEISFSWPVARIKAVNL